MLAFSPSGNQCNHEGYERDPGAYGAEGDLLDVPVSQYVCPVVIVRGGGVTGA